MDETVNGPGFVDTHCHLLPNLDDGPSVMTEAIEMARVLADKGFREVFCTPHFLKGSYDVAPEGVRKGVKALQEALDGEGISLKVHAGIEYYIDEYLLEALEDPLSLRKEFILVEGASSISPVFLKDQLFQILVKKKMKPVLAHPERCESLEFGGLKKGGKSIFSFLEVNTLAYSNVDPLTTLKDMGCRFQGNIGSFAGMYGERVRRQSLLFLEKGLYDCIGTDAHNSHNLAFWLERGMEMIEKHVGRQGLVRLLRPAFLDGTE